MSFAIEKLVRGIHKDELEGGEYHVALALAFRADDAGYCFPSLLLIAQEAHVTERTVLRSLQRFTGAWSKAEPRNLITKTSHRRPGEKSGGRNNPSGYQFNVALLRSLNTQANAAVDRVRTKDENTDNHDTSQAQETPTITPSLPAVNTDNDAMQTPTSGHETPTLTTVNTDNDASYIGRTDKELKEGTDKGNLQARVSTQAKHVGSSLTELVNEDLEGIAVAIALRHPRSRMRQWTARNVGMAERTAILDAMSDDAQQQRMEMAVVGKAMLLSLDAWDEVPQDRWAFVAAIPKFYKQGDYRLEPKDLPGIAPKEGKRNGNGSTKAKRDTTGNADALREFLESTGNTSTGDSCLSDGPGGVSGSCGYAEPDSDLRGMPVGLQQGAGDPGIQSGGAGVSIFPRPSHPPRACWPRA